MTGGPSAPGTVAVSVVIPTRDRWALLETTLESALAQREVELEVLVVDDGSASTPPSSGPITDPRVRLLRNEVSLGVAGARNRGIDEARGDWIAFLDDDDVWSPEKLRRQLDAAAAGGASFSYAAVVLVTAARGEALRADAPSPDRLPDLLVSYNAIPAGASNVLVETDLVRDVGGFDPQFHHLADWDLWIRIAGRGRGAACNLPLVGYRLHPASMRSTLGGAVAELAVLDRKHGWSGSLPAERIWFYRWLAGGQRLAGRRAAAATRMRGAIRCRSRSDVLGAARILLRGGAGRRTGGPGAELGAPALETEGWLRPLFATADGAEAPARGREDRPGRRAARLRVRALGATALDRALRMTRQQAGVALVYHRVQATPTETGVTGSHAIVPTVSETAFRQQLEYISRRYRLVAAGQLQGAVRSRRRGQPFPLAITFDDDLRTHRDVVLPMLRQLDAVATFFLTGASLDQPASFWWERVERVLDAGSGAELLGVSEPGAAVEAVSALSAEERQSLSMDLIEHLGGEQEDAGLRSAHVAEIAGAGCEVGFHTHAHERLPDLGDEELAEAMRVGLAELEEAAGTGVRSIAYPHGAADSRVAAAARSGGFRCGFTTGGRAVTAGTDPLLIGRLYPSEASLAHFASQISLAIWKSRDER